MSRRKSAQRPATGGDLGFHVIAEEVVEMSQISRPARGFALPAAAGGDERADADAGR